MHSGSRLSAAWASMALLPIAGCGAKPGHSQDTASQTLAAAPGCTGMVATITTKGGTYPQAGDGWLRTTAIPGALAVLPPGLLIGDAARAEVVGTESVAGREVEHLRTAVGAVAAARLLPPRLGTGLARFVHLTSATEDALIHTAAGRLVSVAVTARFDLDLGALVASYDGRAAPTGVAPAGILGLTVSGTLSATGLDASPLPDPMASKQGSLGASPCIETTGAAPS